MKNALAYFFSIIIVISFTGCNMEKTKNAEEHNSSKIIIDNSDTPASQNEILPIYNSNNEMVDKIEHFGTIVQAEDSIIYAKVSTKTNENDTTMDYYKYDISTKENIKLGTVNEWAQQSTESVLINNHLYLFIVTGDISSKEKRILKLLDLNLKNNSMTEVYSEKGGFPYNSMIGKGDRLLIAKVLENGSCIEEYDTKTKKRKTLLSFDFNDATTVGETIRNIYSDDHTISLMMLVKDTADSVQLRVDVYDNDMNFLHSTDVSHISTDANELRQGISNFVFSNGYIYYENFSLTRFLGKSENNKITNLIETNETFSMATETGSNLKTKLFYQSFSEKNNNIYLLDLETGKIRKTSFYADDRRYYIINMSRDTKDNILVVMYHRDPNTGNKLTPRLYSINLSDLHFEQ